MQTDTWLVDVQKTSSPQHLANLLQRSEDSPLEILAVPQIGHDLIVLDLGPESGSILFLNLGRVDALELDNHVNGRAFWVRTQEVRDHDSYFNVILNENVHSPYS